MSPEQEELAEAIAARVLALLAKQADERAALLAPEITAKEAARLAGCDSASAFGRWCKKHRVKPISRGRYRRAAILRGLGE